VRILDLLVNLLDQRCGNLKRKLDESFVEDCELFVGEFKAHFSIISLEPLTHGNLCHHYPQNQDLLMRYCKEVLMEG